MASDRNFDLDALRAELVDVGRRMRGAGVVVSTEGNLSVRCAPDRVLTTPSGVDKGRLQPEDLVVVSLEGEVVGPGRPSTEVDMHLAVYAERPDLAAICHGHPPHATAFAAAHRALDACVLPEIVCELGAIPLTDYGTPSTEEVGAAVRAVFRDHDAALLRNHGVVVGAADPTRAFHRLETVERLAQITWIAESIGGVKALSREQVDRLIAVRGVYGFDRPAPPCRACDD